MLRSDENRERTAYTCIMYMYMYIIISHIYIYLYIARFTSVLNLSLLFFFSRRRDARRTSRKAVEDARRCFLFPFFFVSFTRIKGRFPPLHCPRIYLILVLFFIFLFFSLFFCSTIPARTGASRKVLRRARACFMTVITLFFLRSLSLSLSLSIFRYSLTIIITIRLDC